MATCLGVTADTNSVILCRKNKIRIRENKVIISLKIGFKLDATKFSGKKIIKANINELTRYEIPKYL
jgi:hypothetical protein